MSYDYDLVGNLNIIGDWSRNEYPMFGYDHLNRLTSASGPYTESYGYNAIGNITSKTGVGGYDYYTWGGCSGYRPHAVRTTGVSNYCYDADGNMQWRYEGGHLWLQSWDANNKLTGVQEKSPNDWVTNIGAATTFAYDADGNRVKRTNASGSTYYIGDHTEYRPNVKWTQYYAFAGQRVAMRDNIGATAGSVTWLHGDNLGSARMATSTPVPA